MRKPRRVMLPRWGQDPWIELEGASRSPIWLQPQGPGPTPAKVACHGTNRWADEGGDGSGREHSEVSPRRAQLRQTASRSDLSCRCLLAARLRGSGWDGRDPLRQITRGDRTGVQAGPPHLFQVQEWRRLRQLRRQDPIRSSTSHNRADHQEGWRRGASPPLASGAATANEASCQDADARAAPVGLRWGKVAAHRPRCCLSRDTGSCRSDCSEGELSYGCAGNNFASGRSA